MEAAAHGAESAFGKAEEEERAFKAVPRGKLGGEIAIVIARAYTGLTEGVAFKGDFPVSAPGEFAEPDGAVFLGRAGIRIEGEEGVRVMARKAPDAFEHGARLGERNSLELSLADPAAGKMGQPAFGSPGQIDRAGKKAFDPRRAGRRGFGFLGIAHNRSAREKIVFGKDLELEVRFKSVDRIREGDDEAFLISLP